MARLDSLLALLGLVTIGAGLVACGGTSSPGGPPPSKIGVGGGGANSTSTGQNTGGGNFVVPTGTGGSTTSSGCSGTGTSSGCKAQSPEGCGDGINNQGGIEQCDDGNTVPGDGCNGACKVEPNWDCPPAGA